MSGEPKTLTPQRFRRKDDALSVIEAIQWTGRNTGAVMEWVGEHRNHSTGGMELTFVPLGYPAPELWVEQRGAWVTVRPGDWFIQAAVGFYPCKPDVFAATYEPVGVPVVAADEANDRDDLTTAYLAGFEKGRDAARDEAAELRAAVKRFLAAIDARDHFIEHEAELLPADWDAAFRRTGDDITNALAALRRLAGGENER